MFTPKTVMDIKLDEAAQLFIVAFASVLNMFLALLV